MIREKYLRDSEKTLFNEGNGFMNAVPKFKKVEGAVYTEDGITKFVSKSNILYKVNKSYFEKGEYFTDFKDCIEYTEYSKKDEKNIITSEYYDTDGDLLFVREQGFTYGFCDGSPISGLCIDTAYMPYTETYYSDGNVSEVKYFEYGLKDYWLSKTETYKGDEKNVITYNSDYPKERKTEEIYVNDVLSQKTIYKIQNVRYENMDCRIKRAIPEVIKYYKDNVTDHAEHYKLKYNNDFTVTQGSETYLEYTDYYKNGEAEHRETYYEGYKRISYDYDYYNKHSRFGRDDKYILDDYGNDVAIEIEKQSNDIKVDISADKYIADSEMETFAEKVCLKLIDLKLITNFNIESKISIRVETISNYNYFDYDYSEFSEIINNRDKAFLLESIVLPDNVYDYSELADNYDNANEEHDEI